MTAEFDIPDEDKRLPTLLDLYKLVHYERQELGKFVAWRYKGSNNDESKGKFIGLVDFTTQAAVYNGIDPNLIIFSVEDTGFSVDGKRHNPPMQYAALLPEGDTPLQYMIMIDPQFLDNTSILGLAYGTANGIAHAKTGNMLDEVYKQHTLAIREHEKGFRPDEKFQPLPDQRAAARYVQLKNVEADRMTIKQFADPKVGMQAFAEYRVGVEKHKLLNDAAKPKTPTRYGTQPSFAARVRLAKPEVA